MFDSNASLENNAVIDIDGHADGLPDGAGIIIAVGAGSLFWGSLLALLW